MKNSKKDTAKTSKTETYLSFKLNNELFGVNVKNVLNILEMQKITDVPKSPDYFSGIINLRGAALPVLDLRVILETPKLQFTNNTCILVLEITSEKETEKITFGVIVDGVNEVLKIDMHLIEPAPNIGSKYYSNFISGMWKMDESFIMLLDIEKVITDEKALIINEASVAY